jgi:hypothetical protein
VGPGSRFTLDGLLITGRPIHVRADEEMQAQAQQAVQANQTLSAHAASEQDSTCYTEIAIRHCTLVPGWGLDNNCEPRRPNEPSLELYNVRARVRIEHSILGTIEIHEDQVKADPVPLYISDSIVDATSDDREAVSAPGPRIAHATLTIKRSTVFGIVQAHAVELAENSIFTGCINVARRQIG